MHDPSEDHHSKLYYEVDGIILAREEIEAKTEAENKMRFEAVGFEQDNEEIDMNKETKDVVLSAAKTASDKISAAYS